MRKLRWFILWAFLTFSFFFKLTPHPLVPLRFPHLTSYPMSLSSPPLPFKTLSDGVQKGMGRKSLSSDLTATWETGTVRASVCWLCKFKIAKHVWVSWLRKPSHGSREIPKLSQPAWCCRLPKPAVSEDTVRGGLGLLCPSPEVPLTGVGQAAWQGAR